MTAPLSSSDSLAERPVDVDVLEIDNSPAFVGLDGHALHRVDDEFREGLLFEFGPLAGHRRLGDLLEELCVLGVDLVGDVVHFLTGSLAREVEPLDHRRRVDVLLEEVLGVAEELAGDRDGCRCAVARLVLLCFRDLDDHRRCRVVDVHLLEDRDAVVRDGDVPHRGDEHLVHALGPQRRSYRFGDRLRRRNIVRLGVAVLHSLGVFTEDDHRLPSHSLLLAHSRPNDCR